MIWRTQKELYESSQHRYCISERFTLIFLSIFLTYDKSVVDNNEDECIKNQPSAFAESILANSIFSENNYDINETINATSFDEKFVEDMYHYWVTFFIWSKRFFWKIKNR